MPMKTKAQVERTKNIFLSRYRDITLYELNVPRKDGLFKKYVWVFDKNGNNITVLVAHFLNWRVSRSSIFRGCLMSGGHGFKLVDYVALALERRNYRTVGDLF